MPYDYIEEYQKRNDETIWEFRDKDAQSKISTDETTVEGNPINFTTLSAQKSKSTILSVEPIQDLHGYDKPWVGGAGKNLVEPIMSSGSTNGITCTNNGDGSFTFSGTADGNATFRIDQSSYTASNNLKSYKAGVYTCSGLHDDGVFAQVMQISTWANALLFKNNSTQTLNADMDNCFILLRVDNGVTVNTTVKLMIEKGNTASPWEPYENICPISGRSEIGILGCGKNLLDLDSVRIGIAWNDSDNPNRATVLTPILGNTTYTLKINAPNNMFDANSFFVTQKDANNVVVDPGLSVSNNTAYTFIAKQTATLFVVQFNKTNITKTDFANTTVQLEVGSEATEYVPYAGQSNDLTISLGQTVYSGTLDVENGVLVVDKASITYDGSNDENWGGLTALSNVVRGGIGLTMPNNSNPITNYLPYLNNYSEDSPHFYNYNNTVYVFLPITDTNNFRTYLSSNPLQLCYELATPITIQLTPNEISLLEGVNNISVDDANSTITVTYRNGMVATLEDLTFKVDKETGKGLSSNDYTDSDKTKVDTIEYKFGVENGIPYIEEL